MNIIEIKNNLVKLAYDEKISLASFIKITDLKGSYIAQIIHLESSRVGKIAIARIIFNFKCGIQAYDGSTPSIQAEVEVLEDNFFLNTLDKTEPLMLGRVGENNYNAIISANLLKDKPIICAEKSYQYNQLLENILMQNEYAGRKTVIIDVTGEIKGNKIIATQDFKIPLDKDSIDYIFDRGFEDLTKENKAFIQDIFSELNEYIKTVEYIPFKDFNAVIEYEFKRTQKLQLIILKNRLVQFEKKGIFAQEEKEFKVFEENFKSNNTLIIDLSRLTDSLQVEYINYIYKQMESMNTNFYSFVCLNNNNSSKSMLNTIFGAKNIFSSIVCPYSYNYIDILKQCSKNMFMFTPLKQQNDFGAYNVYLNKLAENEFILYGKSTKFTPIIVKSIDSETIFDFINNSTTTNNIEEKQINDVVETPIIKEEVTTEKPEENTINTDNEEANINSESVFDEPKTQIIEKETTIEIVEDIIEPIQQNEIIENIETPVELTENIIVEEYNEEIKVEETSIEIVENTPVNEEIPEQTETTIEEDFSNISIDIDENEIATAIADRNEVDDLLKQFQNDSNIAPLNPEDLAPTKIITEAEPDIFENSKSKMVVEEPSSTEFSEIVEDEELTDDDLDLIESLRDDTEVNEDIQESIGQDVLLQGLNSVSRENKNEEIEIVEDIEEQETVQIEQTIQENAVEEDIAEETKPKQQSITDEILEEEARKKAEEEANKPDPIEEHIEKPQHQTNKKMETREGVTPIVPVYSAEIPDEDIVESDPLQQGDEVIHSEFGRGVVEKMINYGERILCSINFEEVGRRLLDPKISELKKV